MLSFFNCDVWYSSITFFQRKVSFASRLFSMLPISLESWKQFFLLDLVFHHDIYNGLVCLLYNSVCWLLQSIWAVIEVFLLYSILGIVSLISMDILVIRWEFTEVPLCSWYLWLPLLRYRVGMSYFLQRMPGW